MTKGSCLILEVLLPIGVGNLFPQSLKCPQACSGYHIMLPATAHNQAWGRGPGFFQYSEGQAGRLACLGDTKRWLTKLWSMQSKLCNSFAVQRNNSHIASAQHVSGQNRTTAINRYHLLYHSATTTSEQAVFVHLAYQAGDIVRRLDGQLLCDDCWWSHAQAAHVRALGQILSLICSLHSTTCQLPCMQFDY